MSRYLIDTNILSEPIKSRPNQIVIETMQRHTEDMAIAAVTWHEMLSGCNRLPTSRKRQNLEQYLQYVLSTFPILPYTQKAASWHARERVRLVAIGQTPDFEDSQIAAIAHVNNLTLVTNNISDYANFQDLNIENWFSL